MNEYKLLWQLRRGRLHAGNDVVSTACSLPKSPLYMCKPSKANTISSRFSLLCLRTSATDDLNSPRVHRGEKTDTVTDLRPTARGEFGSAEQRGRSSGTS